MARIIATVALLAALAITADARITAEEAALWNDHLHGVAAKGQATGQVTKLGAPSDPLDAYVAVPPAKAGAAAPTAAVIIFPDIKGWTANNTRIWADKLAANGFIAVLPDWFRGDELANYKGPGGTMGFVQRQDKARVIKDFEALVPAIKKRWPSVRKIGQQGFCWGGYYSALLSRTAAPRVDAAVGYHASLLKPADIDAIKGPISLQASDPKLDAQLNTTLYEYVEKSFAAKRAAGVPATITTYPGEPHGFALRGGDTPAAAKAFDEGAAFLKTHLLAPEGAAAAGAANGTAAANGAAAAAAAPAASANSSEAHEFFNSGAGAAALSRVRGNGAIGKTVATKP